MSDNPASVHANPIWDRHFAGRATLAGKVFDEPRSVQFRKQLLMNSWLRETKPSSVPTAAQVERRGATMTHHVLWMHNEGNALRESIIYQSPTRAAQKTRSAENAIRRYLNQVHSVVKRLKAL